VQSHGGALLGVLCWVFLIVHACDSVPFHILILVQGLKFFKHSEKLRTSYVNVIKEGEDII
jgi:hypothetical protein